MTQSESEEDSALRESIEMYHREMEKVIPAEDDDSLFDNHRRVARRAEDAFHSGTALLDDVSALEDSLHRAFLDVIDMNWKKGEEICNESLDAVENTVLCAAEAATEGEDETQGYWNLMKKLRREYDSKVGSSLRAKMDFVRLEYLDERQETDYDVLMEQFQKQLADAAAAAASASGPESDDGEASTASPAPSDEEAGDRIPLVAEDDDSLTSPVEYEDRIVVQDEETAGKQLKLQLTWGRVLLFWKYWIDCRKETIRILEDIRDLLKEADFQSFSEMSDNRAPGDAVYAQIVLAFPRIPMQFAHIVNKDFRCYKVLLRKLQDFVDLVNCEEYLVAFGVEPKDLFLNISTFQTDITSRQPRDCLGLNISEDILRREQEELSETAQMLSYCSRPLFHLIELFQKLAGEDVLNAEGFQTVIDNLNREEADMSSMFSESLLSFLDVASRVSDAVETLRKEIHGWLPKRDDTITKLNEVIKRLHKTTKDVAITQTVSSSVGIVGGAIAITGLILAPFTLGVSLVGAAVAGGVTSGLGAATALGAAVTEIVIDKNQMELAATCLQEDKDLFDVVVKQIRHLNRISTMLQRYIPQDELEFFISTVASPQSIAQISLSSASTQVDPRIAINIARLVSVGGKAVAMPISGMVLAGTVAASRVAVLAVAHGIAAIGIGLDIANLAIAAVKLGKGAKSEKAEKLEEVVAKLEEEKRIVATCLEDIQCNS